jgi:hypothetical protein
VGRSQLDFRRPVDLCTAASSEILGRIRSHPVLSHVTHATLTKSGHVRGLTRLFDALYCFPFAREQKLLLVTEDQPAPTRASCYTLTAAVSIRHGPWDGEIWKNILRRVRPSPDQLSRPYVDWRRKVSGMDRGGDFPVRREAQRVHNPPLAKERKEKSLFF